MDVMASSWLPGLAAVMEHVEEKPVRDRLLPELVKRAQGGNIQVALAAAAIQTAWIPEGGIPRLTAALDAEIGLERDLAERYLKKNRAPKVTWLLRAALARETLPRRARPPPRPARHPPGVIRVPAPPAVPRGGPCRRDGPRGPCLRPQRLRRQPQANPGTRIGRGPPRSSGRRIAEPQSRVEAAVRRHLPWGDVLLRLRGLVGH